MRFLIVGCGVMGSAFAKGLSGKHSLALYDTHKEKVLQLVKEGIGEACENLEAGIKGAEAIVLAMKPQHLEAAAEQIKKHVSKDQAIFSILAGAPIEALKSYFPGIRVIRVMPNLAVAHGCGMVGLTGDESITQEEKDHLSVIFSPLGKNLWLHEAQLNALTALAGSGPALMSIIIESMIDAGIAMGLSAKESHLLVLEMIKGTTQILSEPSKHPGQLKWEVASPGGTTIAGIRKMEELGVRGGILNAFYAIYERAKQMDEKK